MNKIRKKVLGVLLSVMMLLQVFMVYGAPVTVAPTTPSATPAPSATPEPSLHPAEVGTNFKQLPIYYAGDEVSKFSKFMRKYNDTATNPSEQFDVSGTVRFRVRAYAYGTGNDIKIGTYIDTRTQDGGWELADWQPNEVEFSAEEAKDYMDGKIKLSMEIENIRFAVPNTNKDDLRVNFKIKTSTGKEFDRTTAKSIKFMTDGKVGITRKLTEVPGEKNVWEVEIKLEGQLKPEIPPTEVVFVLDRSGSMNTRVATGQTRAKLVENASKYLMGELVKQQDLDVSVVSFGGTTRNPGSAGYEHFDNNWNSIKRTSANNGWYSNYTIETDFTNDINRLNTAVSSAMNNINGGTPIATALIKAGLLLENSTAKNRVIILLSDGDPTYSRDGSGNGGSSTAAIRNDTILAATQAKSRVNNLKLFTIAAGSGMSANGKEVLEKCATTPGDAYIADDTEAALKGVMNSILSKVEESVGSSTTLSETLSDNVSIEEATGGSGMKVTTVGFKDKENGITDDIDWTQTTIAITQGAITNQAGQNIGWDIGELTTVAPAIMKFRIRLDSGYIGQDYNVSAASKFKYKDSTNKEVINGIPNGQVRLSWAEINLSTYDYAVMSTVPGSQMKIWHKIPKVAKPGDIKINYSTRYNSATNEVNATGDKTIRSALIIPARPDGVPSTIIGALVDDNMYTHAEISDASNGATISKSPVEAVTLINEPDISSIMKKGVNFIQPQGVSNVTAKVEFKVKSKDVSYTVKLDKLVDATLSGNKLMNYDFAKTKVHITKTNDADRILVEGTDYTIQNVGNRELKVDFNGFVDAGDEFTIAIYLPSTLTENVIYGGTEANTYLNKYRNRIVKLDNVIIASPKVADVTASGVSEEVYGAPVTTNSILKPENQIKVIYIEIAKIN